MVKRYELLDVTWAAVAEFCIEPTAGGGPA